MPIYDANCRACIHFKVCKHIDERCYKTACINYIETGFIQFALEENLNVCEDIEACMDMLKSRLEYIQRELFK